MTLNANDSEPFETIVAKAIKLYMDNGRFGKNLFSPAAERALADESEALAAYTLKLAESAQATLAAVFDPVKAEDLRQRALRFYNLVLQSMPQSPAPLSSVKPERT